MLDIAHTNTTFKLFLYQNVVTQNITYKKPYPKLVVQLLENPYECGIKPPGSISHGVS